jgi:hypothetical protein
MLACVVDIMPNFIEKSDLQDNKHIDPLFSNEIILIKLRNILIFDIKQDYNLSFVAHKNMFWLGREKNTSPDIMLYICLLNMLNKSIFYLYFLYSCGC